MTTSVQLPPSRLRSWPRRIMPLRLPPRPADAARGRAAVSAQLALHHRDRRLSCPGAAGLHARLFHLERPDPRHARHPSVRAVRHQPLLSPASDPSRPEMPEMAGACDGGRSRCPACRKRRRAGSRSTAAIISSPTSSPIRTARWSASSGATSAGSWSISRSCRGSESTNATPRTSCATASTSRWSAMTGWSGSILIQMPLFFAAGFAVAWLSGETPAGRGADRTQHPGVRRVRAHRAGLAHHLVGELGDAPVGLPQLRDRRGQPQQLVVGLISNGEGWHNNHHADPRSARHGHRWWEMDNTWLTIRFLEWIGLATDVVAPSAHLKAQAAKARLITRGPDGVPVD